ncbi:MAG TPA: ABC transporter permease, partial [Stellaceae bacterium]|nr:ABC transporter permease [Stellaceae bacterium]
MTLAPTDLALLATPSVRRGGMRTYVRRHPTIVVGATLLALMALMAIFAPYLGTVDPQALSPIRRLRWPSAQY